METTLWKIVVWTKRTNALSVCRRNARRPLDRPTLFRFQFGPMHISVPFIRPERANLVFTLHFQKRVQNFWRLRAHTAGRLMALVFWNSRTLPSNLLRKRKAHFLIPQILSFKMSRKSFLPKLSVSNRRGPFSIQCPSCDYFHRALFEYRRQILSIKQFLAERACTTFLLDDLTSAIREMIGNWRAFARCCCRFQLKRRLCI
jgi:hypothetical protein